MRNSPLLITLAAVLSMSALAAPAAADYKADLLGDLQQLEEKLVGLAEAIPADQFAWRPAEGVRSVSEAFMHTAAANYFFPSRMGATPPEGLDLQGFEKITDKAQVVQTLKDSFGFLRTTVEGATEDQLDGAVSAFGQEMTGAGFLHAALSHNHEHLGQMIAYARSVGVTPPWSG